MVKLEVTNLVSYAEAAKLMGISRPTIYVLIEKQDLHPISIGRNRYLLLEEVKKNAKSQKM